MTLCTAVFDFDGTLTTTRWPHFSPPNAAENLALCELARTLSSAGVAVIILSGRPESHRASIETWLAEHHIGNERVILRPDDAEGSVAEYKMEHLAALIAESMVLFFAEDESSARAAGARLGLAVIEPHLQGRRGQTHPRVLDGQVAI